MILFCGVLSANICKSVTPDLYDAAVAYEQNIKTFVSVLPAATEAASRPDVTKAETVLDVIKGMVAKCNNTIDHKDPAFSDVQNALKFVVDNQLILQSNDPFSSSGLTKAHDCAVAASSKLMALLVEIPATAAGSKKSSSPQSSSKKEDENDQDDADEDDEEESDEDDDKEKKDDDKEESDDDEEDDDDEDDSEE
ncbi:MAG: hypothetical protein WCJ92_02575 [Alphaproteobacteria bacterium]